MKNKLIITLLLLTSYLQAQEKKESYSFSLKEAIDYALEHNYSVINANRDVASAKQKKWETTALGLPQLSGSVGYLNNIDFTLQGVSGNAFNPNGNPDDISLFAFGTKQSMNSNLTLSQLIFDGSYIVALQASKTYLKFYENAKQKTNLEIREMVINAYGNVLLAEESIAILEKNKVTLSKTLSDTQETFKNGLIEEENVEQLQITLASINSNLINVKRLIEIANKMLKLSLGIEINSEVQLTDKLDSLTASNLDLAFIQNGFEVSQSINYQMASNLQEQRSLELKLQKSKALPSLGAAYNFGYNSFSNEFSFADSNQKWNRFSNLGVSLNVPIFSSLGRSAKTQQAKIALEQAKTQLTQTEQQIKLEYERAKSDYDFSIEEYATSKSNLNLAERIEKKQQIKFTEGLSSSFDFNEAQRQLYTAQQNYLQSMVNIINKKASLDKIINKN
ncbi:TolC family protein [Flavobacterium sp.]|jgi:outer membrane protein|uniref:TolC family protein n=1 Tax=Flavobacterium sp. TaxID=239 RepID=UPI0037C180B3